ncbi:MAG: bifunctional oligoribonuclease and phosphatase NrnA [Bacillota bacterium]|nr:bifunctional oligoribonuclease and phosphatase NrnA [Bacillota bacterium]
MQQPKTAAVKRLIAESSEVVLLCHIDPDGDAVGSLLGLGLALLAGGHRVTMISPDGVPHNYAFLPGADRVEKAAAAGGDPVVLVLDCGDLERLGPLKEWAAHQGKLVNIDHHPTNQGFGRYNLVDPGAAATAELVLALIEELALPLTPQVANCLYTGLHTDTGGFRYENTSARAHRAAERLLAAGAKPWEIAENVYNTKPLAQVVLLREALARLEMDESGRIAWMSLPRSVFAACGTNDTGGLIDYPRMIAGVEVALLFKEVEDGTVRVGLRSRRVDVSRLALRFGGGGHARAAGCSVAGPLAHAERVVLAAARQALEEEAGNA